VVLDVVVTDAHNKPVPGLSGRDFKIQEDAVEQKLASFDTPPNRKNDKPSRGVAPAADAASTSNSIPARNILVLDELNNEILENAYGRQSIEKFLRKHGPFLNQPTALVIVGQDKLEFAHDYTRDSSALLASMKRHHAELPFSKLTAGTLAAVQRLAKTLWVLDQIASANLHYAGRKNVIWIGSGFPELNLESIAYRDRDTFRTAIRDLGSVLFDARIAVYTINPEGLNVAPELYDDSFGDLTTGELLFESLAPQTGGRIMRLQNQLDEVIAETVEDGDSYYTLTYYPSNHNWDGKFRTLSVTVNGRELKVRTRKGYYATPTTPLSGDQADTAMSDALVSPLPYRGLDVHATVAAVDSASGKYVVRVDGGALSWQVLPSGKRRCQVTAVTGTMGSGAQFSSHKVRELEAVLDDKDFRKLGGKPVVFNFVAELPRGTHLVKVVLRDPVNGNIGSTEIAGDEIRRN
jgi:VWFA-related protein